MKKLTLVAVLGIALGLVYLALKESPAPVAAPKIKSSEASADAHSASKKYLAERSVVSGSLSTNLEKATSNRSLTSATMVNRRAIRKKHSVTRNVHKQDRGDTAQTAALTKSAVVQAGDVKVPKANDNKWVSHLSGQNVDLEIRRNDLSGSDCTQQICPDKPSAYTLVGVVAQPQRVVLPNQRALDGELATGDGQDRPFVYIK